jgi:hypothetical protein
MATENPTGRGAAVALNIPADQVRFLRRLFTDARAGVRHDLKEFPGQLREPARQLREEDAYGRLLTALDELVIVPDADLRALVGGLAQIIDQGNEYGRVIREHEALHGLLSKLSEGGQR